jgi:AraC family ethanolamine operon transcriptional activator
MEYKVPAVGARPISCYVTKHLRRLAYIAEFGNESLTVLDLCKASERTLRYAFQEHFGVSPKTYLSVYRLNKVRKELRNDHLASIKISDIANQWGFWHIGQFAADYRKLLGGLPSETRAYQRQ